MPPALIRLRDRLNGQTPLLRTFRNTGWLLMAKLLGAVLSLAYLAMAARGLHAAGFGEFALILGLAQGMAALVGFQSWRIVLHWGTAPMLAGRTAQVSALLWFCGVLDLVAGIAGCAITVVLVRYLAPHFGWSRATADHAILFAFVLLLTVRSTAVGALRLYDRFRDGALADTATPVFRMIGALVAVSAGASVDGFLWAWGVAEIATAAAYWGLVWYRVRPVTTGLALADIVSVPRAYGGFWRFGLFSNLNSTLSSASQQVALLAVGYAVGAVSAGYFRLAHQLGQALLILAEMLSRSLYAELARVSASRSRAAMTTLLDRTNKAALFGGVAVFAVVAILGKPALYLIGGAAYLPAFPALVILGAAAAVQLIGVSFEPALMALGRTGSLLVIRATALLCLAGLLALLLPRIGVLGAALAMLADALVAVALLRRATRRVARAAPPSP
ncbi:lipopolysaccharide biosynthesis protein [Sphingomonas sp. NFR15]|uniref:lipopolysaccharide biosynthesis protein n=1 Tax=Sphingomonas sp. NFR15 TaxID=1566282 RepID=UPI000885B5EB|nr:lipopolysaccharide biosynthesis protein [Sphingomonas sp. NFR15]SDA24498.1 Membrane protein involved in the export of O-antigen and teichoic acid [Sphingomonas sp. NFR15]